MSANALTDFVKLLTGFEPGWVLAISVCCILAWRAPKIVKAFRAHTKGK